MLEMLKMLLEDKEKESVLEFFLNLAKNNVKLYLNQETLKGVDDYVIVLIAGYYYENRTRLGSKIQSETNGDKTTKYNTYITSIPVEFMGMLPKPRVGVIG